MSGSFVPRLLSALALVWLLAVPLPAAADSCAVASTGSNTAVAGDCKPKPTPPTSKPTAKPTKPPTKPPSEPPPPGPAPQSPAPPAPSAPPGARPAPPHASSVAYPAYRPAVRRKPASGPSVLHVTLLVMAPAVLAAAVLRPRSSR